MKKINVFITFLCGVILLGIFAFKTNPIDKRVNIKDAFDQGIVELKFEALENGKILEITAKNLTTNPLSLCIAKDTTSFTPNYVIVTTKIQNLDIPANGSTKFKVNQKSGGMISGSVTLRKTPKK